VVAVYIIEEKLKSQRGSQFISNFLLVQAGLAKIIGLAWETNVQASC
jgi:hypothetical protein